MAETAPTPAGERRVLVADDEPHVRRILTTLLQSRPFQIDTVPDGRAAMDALEGDTHYDLVLLDLMMPEASGLEVLARVQELDHRLSLPIVVLTAKGQDTDREQAFSLGAKHFVTKPFSPKKLLALIDTLLERP